MKEISHLAGFEDLRPESEGKGSSTRRYVARDRNTNAPVVVVVLKSPQADEPAARQRFLRSAGEAASVRQASLPAITRVAEEDGNCFYVREFVEGETLERKVRRDGPLKEREVLEVGLQAAQALAAMARIGLVHRRIEPGNFVLTPTGTLKILDFELAHPEGAEDGDEAVLGRLAARLEYASPEQLAGQSLDIASDVYCLGVTLWSLLTGQPPFRGTPCAVIGMHLHQSAPMEELSHVNPAIVALLARMLDKSPQGRPNSPLKLIAQIRLCLDEDGTSAARAISPGVAGTVARMAVPKRKRFLFAESVIGALIAGAIYFVLSLPMPSGHSAAGAGQSTRLPQVVPAAAVASEKELR
jgi:serine/threonine-protein kinase